MGAVWLELSRWKEAEFALQKARQADDLLYAATLGSAGKEAESGEAGSLYGLLACALARLGKSLRP